jgi:hypothetical protein
MTLGYAIFFDYKRRNDPNFRKQLKKESKRQARAAKEEAEASTIRQRQAIRAAVEEAKDEGFPSDVEEYVNLRALLPIAGIFMRSQSQEKFQHIQYYDHMLLY